MNTEELDLAVANCEGVPAFLVPETGITPGAGSCWVVQDPHKVSDDGAYFKGIGWCVEYSPSTNWAQGGPIIERKEIQLSSTPYSEGLGWYASMGLTKDIYGNTPLEAAMCCYVAARG